MMMTKRIVLMTVLFIVLSFVSVLSVSSQSACDTRLLRSPALDNFDNWVDRFFLSLAGYPGAPSEQEYVYVLDYNQRISAYDDWSLLVGTNSALASAIKLDVSIAYATTSGQSSDFISIADFTPAHGTQALYKFNDLQYFEPGGFPMIAAVKVRGYVPVPSSDDPLNPSPYLCGVTPCSLGLDVLKFERYECATPTPTSSCGDNLVFTSDPGYTFYNSKTLYGCNDWRTQFAVDGYGYDPVNDRLYINTIGNVFYEAGYFSSPFGAGHVFQNGDVLNVTASGSSVSAGSATYAILMFGDGSCDYASRADFGSLTFYGDNYIGKTLSEIRLYTNSGNQNYNGYWSALAASWCTSGTGTPIPTVTSTPTVAGTFTPTPTPTVTGTPPTSTPTVTGTPPTSTATRTATATPTPFPSSVPATSTPTADLTSTATPTLSPNYDFNLIPMPSPTIVLPSIEYSPVITATTCEYTGICGANTPSFVVYGGCASYFAFPSPPAFTFDLSVFVYWLGSLFAAVWFNIQCFLQSLWGFVVGLYNFVLLFSYTATTSFCFLGEFIWRFYFVGQAWINFILAFLDNIDLYPAYPTDFLGFPISEYIQFLQDVAVADFPIAEIWLSFLIVTGGFLVWTIGDGILKRYFR